MLGQDLKVLDLGLVVRLVEYDVVPGPPSMYLVEQLRVPEGILEGSVNTEMGVGFSI